MQQNSFQIKNDSPNIRRCQGCGKYVPAHMLDSMNTCSHECRQKLEREDLERAGYDLCVIARESAIWGGPVKVYTPEEIEAIKHEITPIEQIRFERIRGYETSW